MLISSSSSCIIEEVYSWLLGVPIFLFLGILESNNDIYALLWPLNHFKLIFQRNVMQNFKADMDGLKPNIEAKMDGIESKMDGLKAGMEILTKVLQERLPSGDKVIHENHDEDKRNMNYDFRDSNFGLKNHHIPNIYVSNFEGKDMLTWIL